LLNARSIIDHTQHVGPMSTAELVRALGLSKQAILRALKAARPEEPSEWRPKLIRVAKWERIKGQSGSPVPFYAGGDAPDAPKPYALKRATTNRKYWARHATEINRRRRAKDSGVLRLAGPFDGLLNQ
jgi:hypothetical protein